VTRLKYNIVNTRKGIHLIEEVGKVGIKILIFLARRGKAKLTEFRTRMGAGYEGIYSALYKLRELGLIEEKREGNTRFFKLTEEGKKIADLLEQADRYLIKLIESRGPV